MTDIDSVAAMLTKTGQAAAEAAEAPDPQPDAAPAHPPAEAAAQADPPKAEAAPDLPKLPEDPEFELKADGEVRKVRLSELQRDYQWRANHTRRSQQLAELEKAAKARQEQLEAEHRQRMEALDAHRQQLEREVADIFTDPQKFRTIQQYFGARQPAQPAEPDASATTSPQTLSPHQIQQMVAQQAAAQVQQLIQQGQYVSAQQLQQQIADLHVQSSAQRSAAEIDTFVGQIAKKHPDLATALGDDFGGLLKADALRELRDAQQRGDTDFGMEQVQRVMLRSADQRAERLRAATKSRAATRKDAGMEPPGGGGPGAPQTPTSKAKLGSTALVDDVVNYINSR